MSIDRTTADVIIVGAGLSGLIAANTLHKRGVKVLLLDKARWVGGRMATRPMGVGRADHGAQFFTVRTPEFQKMVDQWIEEDLVFEWSRGWSGGSLQRPADEGFARYAVRGGMNQLPVHLAEPLKHDTILNVQVDALRQTDDGWELHEKAGNIYHAPRVLLTAPMPQSLAILDNGETTLAPDDRAALDRITFAPCLTALFVIEGDAELPNPGAIQHRDAPISWIANNKQKGISETTVITVQADGQYSAQIWDAPDDYILNSLRTDLMVYLPENIKFIEEDLKRWRYAMPLTLHTSPYLKAQGLPPLFFAGDAFNGPRVEGAVLSGLAVGSAMLETV